jgi:hypothetical protein
LTLQLRQEHDSARNLQRESLGNAQARNKPTEAPQKPEAAPFFLPSSGMLLGISASQVAPTLEVATPPSHPLRMLSHSAAAAVGGSDSTEESDGVLVAPQPQRQVVRNRAAATRLWQDLPLLQALAEGQEVGDYGAAVAWLSRASAVAVERAVLSIAAEEPYTKVCTHVGFSFCHVWSAMPGASSYEPCLILVLERD